MTSKTTRERLDAVKELLQLFQMERMVYIGVTLIALATLLGCAIYLIFGNTDGELTAIGVGMFGASGAITFTISRLLWMWNQAFQAILGDDKEEEEKDDK